MVRITYQQGVKSFSKQWQACFGPIDRRLIRVLRTGESHLSNHSRIRDSRACTTDHRSCTRVCDIRKEFNFNVETKPRWRTKPGIIYSFLLISSFYRVPVISIYQLLVSCTASFTPTFSLPCYHHRSGLRGRPELFTHQFSCRPLNVA
jgi:hypothetical protein